MTKEEMLQRTKAFALRVVRVVQAMPDDKIGDVLGRQLLRCGTSVGANYRAACRAKSTSDFINKLKIVEEECDESLFWIEMITDSELIPHQRLKPLHTEADEILAITVAALRTTRASAANKS